ncbi:hypothetical protein [Bremerella alba]|uniref:Bacterial membrane protein YfhO n=1 Tax=Bremerella alba TaxID=980252 RepID=A0A7V9A804_9BACT|nr:hypothetical protein [Bremerella alba]MBA2115793.1 hypothetical protein [Bremerella alba]
MNENSASSPVRPDSLHRLQSCVGIWLPFLFLATFFFGNAFAKNEQFLFRDAAHFYYPLFHEVTRQWKAGEVPLWSPFDGIGMPLAADATPSVFYPGKLLLLTPLGFNFGMRLVVVLHFALAYGGMFWAARIWRCSVFAALLAAITYAFGGPVLSYHANIIFLVGASWLPFALANGWLIARRPALLPGLGLALSLTMMILGGDPQLAFHTMMMLALAAVLFVQPWRRPPSWRRWFTWRTYRMGALVGCAMLAAGLSAIQILPTSEWASRSLRATADQPRNVYELAQGVGPQGDDRLTALLGNPKPNTHALHSYDFSIGPWNWPNTFIANFSGKMYPLNERWVRAIPAEGRIWFVSLFIGTLTVFLAGYAIWNRPSRRVDRWLVAIGLFGLIASLGWYGLGWLILEVGYGFGWEGKNLPVGSPFGGLYWLLNVLVPKYAQFRYPAKWWIFFAFAVSLLAARGLDQLCISQRLFGWTAMVALVFLIAGGSVLLSASWLGSMLPISPNDNLFGPLDPSAGISQMALGLVSAGVALAVGVLGLYFLPRRLAFMLVLLVAATELAIGNGWVAPTASQDLWQSNGFDLTSQPLQSLDFRPTNYFDRRDNLYPPEFAEKGSADRMIAGLKIDRKNNFPRFHLLDTVRFVPSVVSITPRDHETIWTLARSDQPLMNFLRDMHGVGWQPTNGPWPAAWWQADIDWHSPIDPLPPNEHLQETKQLLESLKKSDRLRLLKSPDWGQSPLTYKWDSTNRFPVILEAAPADRPSLPTAPPAAIVSTKLDRTRAGQMTLHLSSSQPGWAIFREYFDPGWQCTITDGRGKVRSGVSIFRANRILMAVPIKAGDTKVTLTYWPQSFVIGAVLSGFSWLAVVVLLVAKLGFAISKRR